MVTQMGAGRCQSNGGSWWLLVAPCVVRTVVPFGLYEEKIASFESSRGAAKLREVASVSEQASASCIELTQAHAHIELNGRLEEDTSTAVVLRPRATHR